MESLTHEPVLADEVIALLKPQPGARLLDATLGLGGHSRRFLEAAGTTGTVVGLETDAQALATARKNLAAYGDRVTYYETNFAFLKDSVFGGGILQEFTHVLFDLGIGSHQLSDTTRGFSFRSPAPLHMQFGHTVPPSMFAAVNRVERQIGSVPDAWELIHYLSADELSDIIHTLGEERYARRIASAIKDAWVPTVTAQDLAHIIEAAVPGKYRHGRIHPATRTFQALRMATNRELEALELALPQAVDVLKPQGIIAVISFHSLEDRIVKQFFRRESQRCICPPGTVVCTCDHTARLTLITKRPVQVSEEERARNPRARSAKLRVAQKIP